jgi:hypothetical protein
MISPNALLIEQVKLVVGLAPIAPSTSTPDYVSLKGYGKCAVVIVGDNGATVTGSDITLKQATAVAGTNEKELAFAKAYKNEDVGAGDALTEFTVTNNTFTTLNTDNKNVMYFIEVDETDLDINNGFDCVRAGTGNATNSVLAVLYLLYPARVGKVATPSAIID